MTRRLLPLALTLLALLAPGRAHAARILEVCEVAGVRDNQLVGYGLVVGLNNTGDYGRARFTLQSTAAMLRRLGATVDPRMIQTRNAAAVMVTATLPASANPGTHIDVTVSSLGNARSLSGGTLLQTPLYGADREVYAVAQGAVLLGGYGASGRTGSRVSRNHLTAGRVPEGAIVEQRVPGNGLRADGPITLTLREPSFITARRVVEAIDGELGDGAARAVDSGTVEVTVPEDAGEDRVGLLARIQVLEVEPESRARVVIDERTGTVVVGANVRLGAAAIAQGGLTVQISEQPAVSQPNVLADGDTTTVDQSDVEVQAEGGALRTIGPAASLEDVVNALNALGARPRDLIAIFQALRSAGALQAEIEVQ
ncbi:MAG TPA: flagellar basal body P-ring protein FlgI [Sandaracinaceae bacterium LLY-WYZ-13_1]|nr:flagellar basal body P-ring protein FlgI [Sandaracinaceae bacterium LLY-WYZ-13_1]